jgi:hypothetical protein
MRANALPGENTMKPRTITAAMLALGLSAGAAAAQPAKSLKDQLVGTWNFLVAEVTTARSRFHSARRPKAF